jgi:zinc protease
MPEVSSRCLDWGLRLVVARVGHLPMVHSRLLFRRGRVLEAPDLPGSARLLSLLARHGTRSHTSVELAEALDQLGLRLRFSMGQDSSVVSMTCLSEHWSSALALLEEVAFHPSYPEHHLKRERQKALDIHRHECNDPGFLSSTTMGRLLYPDHPYGRPAATESGLRETRRSDILELHRAVLQPAHGMLLVLGDVDAERTLDELSERYREPFGGVDAPVEVPNASVASGSNIVAIERAESEQVQIGLAMRLFPRSHPDYYPVTVMNRVLGAGASSRLFMELRERQSLTYGAYSALDLGRYGGDLFTSLDCAPEKAPRALDALCMEVDRMRDEIVSEIELNQAKRTMSGNFPNRVMGLGGLAGLLSSQWSHSLPEDVWTRHLERIAQVTAEQVWTAAKQWLSPEGRQVVLVGPPAALDAALKGRGPVERRDARSMNSTTHAEGAL